MRTEPYTAEELQARTALYMSPLAILATNAKRLATQARTQARRGNTAAARRYLRQLADLMTGNPTIR